MRWIEKMKSGIKSWLNIKDANPLRIQINETLDYESNAIRNRIWYRGDSNEIQQLYEQINTGVDRYKFWACKSSPGMEIRKIHTGLPSLIIDTLTTVTLSDLKDFAFVKDSDKEIWDNIDKENKFKKKLEKAVKEVLYIGDGAFKLSFDKKLSDYPILEFYPGDRIEVVSDRGRIQEVIFKTVYEVNGKEYVLREYYGYGYIKYELYNGDNLVDLRSISQTSNLVDVSFSGYKDNNNRTYMLAIPIQFFESGKWDERGQSIFDRKLDSFDAFDEVFSQWMDALRAGRSKEYIPECFLPKNPYNGKEMKPNSFDNRFIKTDSDMTEGVANKIDLEQPDIPHNSYLATYVTALDLCLQGIISPSTLGIDMKKLDNAEAQREKEKATLYSRNAIVAALKGVIHEIIEVSIKAYNEFYNKPTADVDVEVWFGEYANPSFESVVETIGKGKIQGILSIEACIDELYGDSRDKEWKQEEIIRLKTEQGLMQTDEPSISGYDTDMNTEEVSDTNEILKKK